MAKVRFVDLSPDNMQLFCSVDYGSFHYATIDSNVNYTAATPFVQVLPSASVYLEIVDQRTYYVYPPYGPVTLEGGKVYTVIIYGSSLVGGLYPLSMSLINNN